MQTVGGKSLPEQQRATHKKGLNTTLHTGDLCKCKHDNSTSLHTPTALQLQLMHVGVTEVIKCWCIQMRLMRFSQKILFLGEYTPVKYSFEANTYILLDSVAGE